jgi:hypothetical protein
METKVKKEEITKGVVTAKANASDDLRGLFEVGLKICIGQKNFVKIIAKND